MALARLGVSVGALMGLDEQAAVARELDVLRAAGVVIAAVPLARGPVFDNTETPAGRVQICHSASEPLPVSAMPASWRAARAVLLNPVAGELDWRWARTFEAHTLVALGWQGLLRRLVRGRPVEALPLRPMSLIARADIATVSTEDASGGARTALTRLLPRAGQQLVVTSDRGFSMHLRRDGAGAWAARTVPVRPSAAVRDPTGAGDVFLATWLAAVIAAGAAGLRDDWRPLALAATAAGAKVEAAALDEMPDLRALCARLRRPD